MKRKLSQDGDAQPTTSSQSPPPPVTVTVAASTSPSPSSPMDAIHGIESSTSDIQLKGEQLLTAKGEDGAAHRVYLAHTAPHLFHPHSQHTTAASTSASPSSSRSPSPSPSLTASPRHNQPSSAVSTTVSSSQSRHIVPHKYRGPMPRDTDAETVAPHPTLQAAPATAVDHLYTTPNTPLNRNSWRYTFAGPDTVRHPTSVYRSIPSNPDCVRWDWSDRSAFTQISKDADVVTSDRGWRAARANVPVRQGSWYCEIQILSPDEPLSNRNGATSQFTSTAMEASTSHTYHPHPSPMKDGPHVRVGWGRREAPLNAPVGFDGYSYGLRDTTGQAVFLSRTTNFASRSFAPGDTIGMYIHLPPLSKPSPRDAKDPRHIRRKWIPIRYRGQVYFEQLDYTHTREMERLLEKSWAGEKILRPDGGLKLKRVEGPMGRIGNEEGEWVEVEAGQGEEGDEGEGITRAGGSGAKMKKQKSVKQASSTPTPAPGGSAIKGGKGSKGGKSTNDADAAEEEKQKKRRVLRPLPTLGPSSRIGFFHNGEPLGWAFRDLLDYRPLRAVGASASKGTSAASSKKGSGSGSSKKQGGQGHVDTDVIPSQLDPASLVSLSTLAFSSQGEGGSGGGSSSSPSLSSSSNLDFVSAPLLTTSASLSAIMKSRENPYDDGCCGYFPMVSLYGAARARLIAKREEMKFLPRGGFQDMERSLERAHRRSLDPPSGQRQEKEEEEEQQEGESEIEDQPWWGATRPLEDLYHEYWQEQGALDLEEEGRAKARAEWLKTLIEEDEEEEGQEEEEEAAGNEGTPSRTPPVEGVNRNSPVTGENKKRPVPPPAPAAAAAVVVKASKGKNGSGRRDSTKTPTPSSTPGPGPGPEMDAQAPSSVKILIEEEQQHLLQGEQEREREREQEQADSALSPSSPPGALDESLLPTDGMETMDEERLVRQDDDPSFPADDGRYKWQQEEEEDDDDDEDDGQVRREVALNPSGTTLGERRSLSPVESGVRSGPVSPLPTPLPTPLPLPLRSSLRRDSEDREGDGREGGGGDRPQEEEGGRGEGRKSKMDLSTSRPPSPSPSSSASASASVCDDDDYDLRDEEDLTMQP